MSLSLLQGGVYILSVVVHTLVYAYFLIIPFQSRLRLSKRNTLLAVLAYTAIFLPLFWMPFPNAGLAPQPNIWFRVLWIALTLICAFALIRGNPLELLFSLLIVFTLQENVVLMSRIIFGLGVIPTLFDPIIDAHLVTMATILLFVPALHYLFCTLMRQVVETHINFSYWRLLPLLPAVNYLFQRVSNYGGIGNSGAYTPHDLVVFVLLNVAFLLSYVIILRMLLQIHSSFRVVEQAEMMETQLEMQKAQYADLTKDIHETSRIRHDLRHHLLAIQGLAEQDKLSEVGDYLDSYCKDWLNEK